MIGMLLELWRGLRGVSEAQKDTILALANFNAALVIRVDPREQVVSWWTEGNAHGRAVTLDG